MKIDDEALQQKIESGQHDLSDADSKSYVHVYTALKQEPDFSLPPNFADKVVQRALAMQQQKESLKDMWWLAAGVLLLSICLVCALAFTRLSLNIEWINQISAYKGFLFTGAVLIALFTWIDKRFIRVTLRDDTAT